MFTSFPSFLEDKHSMRFSSRNLAHLHRHHVTVTLTDLTPDQLTILDPPPCPPRRNCPLELRLHFWVPRAGFPAQAMCFCTHISYEITALYNMKPSGNLHTPIHVNVQCPEAVGCGLEGNKFILELNRWAWKTLQEPVQNLNDLTGTMKKQVEVMLKECEEDGEEDGEEEDKKGHVKEDEDEVRDGHAHE